MANLSLMRGSIRLDGNEVCHVALLKRTGKEDDREGGVSRSGAGWTRLTGDKIPELHT